MMLGVLKFMKKFKVLCLAVGLSLSAGLEVQAQSTIIYQDDFEGTVTGWSNNTTDFDPDVTRFLGRFANNPTSTTRSFAVPPNTDYIDIELDFYKFDSWDNSARFGFDRLEFEIDNNQIFSLPFAENQNPRSGSTGTVDWDHFPTTGRVELAFNTGRFWFDQLHQFNIRVNNPGSTLTLTLRADLTQNINDESGGFDNITITAFPLIIPPNLTATKTVETVGNGYNLPGGLVNYTISTQSTGGAVDADSVVLVDKLPPETTLFTGDLDGAGNPVIFTDSSTPASGLTCCDSSHIAFSDSITDPPVFGYIPQSSFDDAITHIRISPEGSIRDATVDPVDVDFTFQARIK